MTYQEAVRFKKECEVVSGMITPTDESQTLKAPDGSLWYWWNSKLEYPENGWSLTPKREDRL